MEHVGMRSDYYYRNVRREQLKEKAENLIAAVLANGFIAIFFWMVIINFGV